MFLPPNLQRKNGPHKTSMIRVRPLKAAIIWQILSCDKYNNPGFWVVIPKTTNATPVVKKKVAVSTPNNEEWYQWRCIPATRLITAPECWSNPIDSNLIKQFYFFEVIVIHNSCWQGKARKTNGVAPHASAALVPQTTIAVWQFLQKKGRNPDINHLQKPISFTWISSHSKNTLVSRFIFPLNFDLSFTQSSHGFNMETSILLNGKYTLSHTW